MGQAAIFLLAAAISLLAVALLIMRPMRLELEIDFKRGKTTDAQPDSPSATTESRPDVEAPPAADTKDGQAS